MITIELKDEDVRAVLDRLARAVTDLTPAMQEIGETLVASSKKRFNEGVAPDGTPWAPKSQATLDAYAARKDPVHFKPLFGPSGRLRKEIFSSAGNDRVEVGSNLIYAAVMQFGAKAGEFGMHIGKDKHGKRFATSTPWGDIPARPFIGISDDDRDAITEIAEEWLHRAADRD